MTLLLNKHRNSTFYTIIGFISGSIVVLFFNFQIYCYYLAWAGKAVEGITINQLLPIYAEIPIGIVVLILCMVGSYMLVRLERKNRIKEVEEIDNQDEKKGEN